MAANLQQQMAAAGQMMPHQQQPRRGAINSNQLTGMVAQHLMNNPVAVQGWQAGVQLAERMGKAVNL